MDSYSEASDPVLKLKIWNLMIPLHIDIIVEDVVGTEKPNPIILIAPRISFPYLLLDKI